MFRDRATQAFKRSNRTKKKSYKEASRKVDPRYDKDGKKKKKINKFDKNKEIIKSLPKGATAKVMSLQNYYENVKLMKSDIMNLLKSKIKQKSTSKNVFKDAQTSPKLTTKIEDYKKLKKQLKVYEDCDFFFIKDYNFRRLTPNERFF